MCNWKDKDYIDKLDNRVSEVVEDEIPRWWNTPKWDEEYFYESHMGCSLYEIYYN